MKKGVINSFGIIGGDKRQLFLAKSLSDGGNEVLLAGFDNLASYGQLIFSDINYTITNSNIIIFPLPSVRTDKSINTPFSNEKLVLSTKTLELLNGKIIFVAMKNKFLKAYPTLKDQRIYDYSEQEEFAILNSLPTAEGALQCAMQRYEGTINGSNCLVVGYGRIGKALSKLLCAMGATVTVSARNKKDFAYINTLGYNCLNTNNLKSIRGFDIVFNTVPTLIFNDKLLLSTDKNTLIIDLASLPGGVDFESTNKYGIDAVRALSLPGKVAPKTAGDIIKLTVFNILEEVYR